MMDRSVRVYKARGYVDGIPGKSPRVSQLEARDRAQKKVMQALKRANALAVSDWTITVAYDRSTGSEYVEVELLGEIYE